MKTAKFKVLFPMLMISFAAFTWGGMKFNPPGSGRFQKERHDIRADLSNIQQGKLELKALKAEKKADKKAGLKEEVIVDRKEIAKTKADLLRDKRYLIADKKDLKRDYRLMVKEEREEAKGKGSDLASAKAQLRKDLRTKNSEAIEKDAAVVATLMRSHNAQVAALEDLKEDREADWYAVNQEIKDSRQQPVTTGYASR
jgi:hypothetical protein